MRLPSWLTTIIRYPARWLEKDQLTVVFFGKTGVGKSSTLNALFGLNWDTDHAISCTKKPKFIDFTVGSRKEVVCFALALLIKNGLHRLSLLLLKHHLDTWKSDEFPYHKLRVVDLPGIGETPTADRKYMAYYKKWLTQADVLVWITQADTRAYKRDEIFLKKLKPFFKKSLFLILAINKIDCLGVYAGEQGFDIDKREPSPDQLRLIPEKIDDIYGIFQNALDGRIIFEKSQVVPYTSVYSWGLDNLKTTILIRRSRIMLEWIQNQSSKIWGSKNTQMPLRLVVGLNQVDKITPDGWNEKLNQPTKEAKTEIERRCDDAIKNLIKETGITDANMEYYSALKRYRLMYLLNKIIKNAYVGFKLGNINPRDPLELALDSEAKEYADKEREKMRISSENEVDCENPIFNELEKIISKDELDALKSKLQQEAKSPPKVAVIGKAGVGKTTTINNLFNAELKTSPTTVGTTQAQTKEFTLSAGGTLTVIDLPGYGRSEKEDQDYEKIYQDLIPSCDMILLVLQADAKDFTDDIEMIKKINKWVQDCPNPKI